MNDTLKNRRSAEQEGTKTVTRPRRTLIQNWERLTTRLRVLRLRSALQKAAEEPAEAVVSAEAAAPAEKSAAAPRTGILAEGARLMRRWKHVRQEHKAKRFPESNRLPLQILFFVTGAVPMCSALLREKLRNSRRKAIHRFDNFNTRLLGRFAHPVVFLGVTGLVAAAAITVSLYTFGVTVTYDGEVVGKAASAAVADTALESVEDLAGEALGTEFTLSESRVRYSGGIIPRSEVESAEELQAELSENIDEITYGYSLYVGGEFIGATPYEGALEELIRKLVTAASTENTVSVTFQEEVEIVEGYVATEKIMNLGYVAERLYSTKTEELTYTVKKGDTWGRIASDHGMSSSELLALNPGYNINKLSIGEVLTISASVPYLTITVTEQERYVAELPYDIEYTDTADLYKGDYKVTSKGVYGSADTVANVTYVNGVETERVILSSVTLKEPVAEQQLRGTTARPTWHATGKFRWPASGTLTSKFGKRKSPGGIGSTNHKGIDIANKKGTPVYAADGGKVTYAGWMSGYGYLVRIDHMNGYTTYYGHCSKLLVKVGDKVHKGEQIAKIGSTGTATGNCLHFEVRYNGTAKNPLNYLP